MYYFRFIFHDWPDRYCATLLRALIPALKRGARVVISDYVVPDLGTSFRHRERHARYVNLVRLNTHCSRA
jgi:hypothetical protein